MGWSKLKKFYKCFFERKGFWHKSSAIVCLFQLLIKYIMHENQVLSMLQDRLSAYQNKASANLDAGIAVQLSDQDQYYYIDLTKQHINMLPSALPNLSETVSTISTTSEVLVQILTHQSSVIHIFMMGKLKIEGNVALGMAFLAA
jgi:alkyl sulfatase BDS1-like metallo-beta-lactamase superfamily hydrolase